jgi:hypothetical protein
MKRPGLIVLLAFVLVLSGCAEFQSTDQRSDPITQSKYFLGQLRYTEITPIERAWRAVQLALKEMNYRVKSSEHDLLQAKVFAVAEGKEVKIELEETSPTTTEIRIRAGKVGDKVLANEFLAAIRKHI